MGYYSYYRHYGCINLLNALKLLINIFINFVGSTRNQCALVNALADVDESIDLLIL